MTRRKKPYSRNAMNKQIRENEAEAFKKYPKIMWTIYIIGFLGLFLAFMIILDQKL